MAGLLGDFEDRILSPLFLGGAALLGGEGMNGAMRGMQLGGAFQDQRRQLAEQERQKQQFQGLLADPSVTGAVPPPMLRIAQMAGPAGGPEMLSKFIDPAREADLAYKKALTLKAQREASGGANKYGKTGAVFQGPDGSFYTMQFAEDGTRKVEPVQYPGQNGAAPTPLTPARGVDVIGDEMYSKATGQPVRNVGGNIAEGERQKAVGEGQGKGQLGLPKAATALRDYEIKNGLVVDEIDRALSQAGPWTTGFVGNVGSYVAGTPAHNLSKTLIGIQSNLGFDTLQQMRENSPTGGALGSVTERELELLQSTWGSLVQSQSEEQFRHNLGRLKQIKSEYATLKRQAYERDVARFGSAAVPNPDGGGAALAGRGAQPFVSGSGAWSIKRID